MNKFDEAKILSEINERIEAYAFEYSIDYKPMDDTLEPRDYAERGFIVGQQRILEELIEKRIISPYDLLRLNDE